MLSYTAMGVTDTLLVGWIGKTKLAAVGLGTTAVFLVNAFFLGTLHGVKVISAQATGAKRGGMAYSAGSTGAAMGVAFGFAVLLLSLVDAQIFALMGGPEEIQLLARQYFNVRVWAAPFLYVTIALCDFHQGTGDTKTPMKVNLMANGFNIVLDLVFIFGLGPIPAMGCRARRWPRPSPQPSG
jgi:MATE family multidrug resistance protein